MGLDITAYEKLYPFTPSSEDERQQIVDGYHCYVHAESDYYEKRAYIRTIFRPYDNPDFPGRMEGLVGESLYRAAGTIFAFRAGSYSGYTDWRSTLAKLCGTPEHRESTGPFAELIWFADNEGTIGPVVSAKLSKDFSEWADRAKGFARDPYFFTSYVHWRRAFELASNGGAVDFH
jgi:hypothetical protein